MSTRTNTWGHPRHGTGGWVAEVAWVGSGVGPLAGHARASSTAMIPSDASRVVVGVDDSPGSFLAVDHAAAAAARHDQGLHLLHVRDPIADPPPLAPEAAADLVAELAVRVRARFPAVPVTTEHAAGGVAAVLVDRAAGAGLLVVGSRCHDGFARRLAWSVAEQVATFAPVPVMVVRTPRPPNGADWTGNPVLVGVDGSPAGEAAVRFAVREAVAREVLLVALHAPVRAPVTIGGRAGCGDPLWSGVLAAAEPAGSGLVVNRRRVAADPYTALMAASRHAGLVVVGARGRGGSAAPRLGSVSQSLIHHAHCPVTVVDAAGGMRPATWQG